MHRNLFTNRHLHSNHVLNETRKPSTQPPRFLRHPCLQSRSQDPSRDPTNFPDHTKQQAKKVPRGTLEPEPTNSSHNYPYTQTANWWRTRNRESAPRDSSVPVSEARIDTNNRFANARHGCATWHIFLRHTFRERYKNPRTCKRLAQ